MARVLVIMPLSADDQSEAKRIALIDALGDDVILPKVAANNDVAQVFNISETIHQLKDVDLVIADLSFERPSCYYELGMVQAMCVQSFLIAQHGTRLHQHFGAVTFYKDIESFRRIIKAAIAEHLSK